MNDQEWTSMCCGSPGHLPVGGNMSVSVGVVSPYSSLQEVDEQTYQIVIRSITVHVSIHADTVPVLDTFLTSRTCFTRKKVLVSEKKKFVIYYHSIINVVQSNRVYNVKNFLVVTCGLFHCKGGSGLGTCWSPSFSYKY
jgi:hypothetical protein